MRVPDIVNAGAFAVHVVPAIMMPFVRTMADWPAAAKTVGDEGDVVGRLLLMMLETVDLPITRSPYDWKAIGVFDILVETP